MNYDCLNIVKWTEAQLKYTYDVSLKDATPQELHEALGNAVMMAISDNWSNSKKARMHNRKAYYISAEYLMGRLVYSNLFSLGILDEMKKLFAERGVDLAVLEDIEDDALGNGGLGRLQPASWILPPAATFLCPAMACAIASACSSRALTTMATRWNLLTTGPSSAIPGLTAATITLFV